MLKDNLKNLRKAVGLSQTQLADMLNVSNRTVSHWEHGNSEPSLSQLKELKSILRVEYDDLLE